MAYATNIIDNDFNLSTTFIHQRGLTIVYAGPTQLITGAGFHMMSNSHSNDCNVGGQSVQMVKWELVGQHPPILSQTR